MNPKRKQIIIAGQPFVREEWSDQHGAFMVVFVPRPIGPRLSDDDVDAPAGNPK